ncbi:hypothetical protein L798_00746, partial [Zootermopsis nevadensis]
MEPVRGKKNIIFLETMCSIQPNEIDDTGLLLTKRQACSIESAAKINSDASVHLLYTCSMNGGIKTSPEYVKRLFKYPNIKIWKLDIPEFLSGTPLQDWNFKEYLETSNWPVEHSSDILRYVSLLKYGGTYLDLDVVIRKSLEKLGTNYLGKESSDSLSTCVLNFASEGIGRNVSEMCVNEILNNFWGESWNHNGPDLVTRVLKKLCGVETVEEMNPDRCSGLKVLPEINFAPFSYPQWKSLFSSTDVYEIMNQMNSSFGVHVWNKLSKDENINLLSTQPYGLLALQFCP